MNLSFLTKLKKTMSYPFKIIFEGFNVFPGGLRQVLFFDFLTSYLFFSFISMIPLFLYSTADIGGLDKFGYSDIQDTAKLRANLSLFASISTMVFGILSIMLSARKIVLWASVSSLVGFIILMHVGTNFWIYAAAFIAVKIGRSLQIVSTYRLIDAFCKSKAENEKIDIRGQAFIQYYIFMNMGAVVARSTVGYIRENLGFSILFKVFFASAIIIFLMSTYIAYKKDSLLSNDVTSNTVFIKENKPTKHAASLFSIIGFLACVSLLITGEIQSLTFYLLPTMLLFIAACFLFSGREIKAFYNTTNKSNFINSILVILGTLIVYKLLRISFDLEDMPMSKWLDEHTNRTVLGHTFPAEFFGSINPILIILLGGIFSNLLIKVKNKGYLRGMADLNTGVCIILVSYFGIALTQWEYNQYGISSLMGPMFFCIFLTLGELVCSPICASYKALAAPREYLGVIYATSDILGSIGNKVLTVIPHEAFKQKNLMPVVYMGVIVAVITITYLSLTSERVHDFIQERKGVKKAEENCTKVKDCTKDFNNKDNNCNEEEISVDLNLNSIIKNTSHSNIDNVKNIIKDNIKEEKVEIKSEKFDNNKSKAKPSNDNSSKNNNLNHNPHNKKPHNKK